MSELETNIAPEQESKDVQPPVAQETIGDAMQKPQEKQETVPLAV